MCVSVRIGMPIRPPPTFNQFSDFYSCKPAFCNQFLHIVAGDSHHVLQFLKAAFLNLSEASKVVELTKDFFVETMFIFALVSCSKKRKY